MSCRVEEEFSPVISNDLVSHGEEESQAPWLVCQFRGEGVTQTLAPLHPADDNLDLVIRVPKRYGQVGALRNTGPKLVENQRHAFLELPRVHGNHQMSCMHGDRKP